MGLGITMVTIDCSDPALLATFWSAALGVSVQGDYGDFIFLTRPAEGGPAIGLQRVPDDRVGKNRIHLDLATPSRASEITRLLSLGASIVAEHELPGVSWTVLGDPEGNQFCVVEHT